MAKKRSGESKSAWFRQFFRDNPDFVNRGSNEEVLARWRAAHAGREPDDSIKNVMANVKSSVKKELNETEPTTRGRKPASAVVAVVVERPTANTPSRRQLEELELALDKCLNMVLNLDNPALETAERHLRRARNLVVWQQGEPS